VYKLRYTLFYFRFQAAIFDFCSPWRRPVLTFVPLSCSMQKTCGFRCEIHIYAICNVRFTCFWFHVRYFDFRLNSHRIVQGDIAISSSDFGILNNNWTQQRWICFQGRFTPFDSMVTKFIPFSPNPPHFHFLWRNSITGWTILKISTLFHHALMVLRNTPKRNEKIWRTTEIFKKIEGVQCLPPAVRELNKMRQAGHLHIYSLVQ